MTAARARSRSERIAVLSPCGWGNLGDAAIVESAIQAIRARVQSANIVGLTLNPLDTSQRHGIVTYTCSGFSRPKYGLSPFTYASPDSLPVESALAEDEPPPNGLESPNGLKAWLQRSHLRAPLGWALSTARALPLDLRHRRLMSGALSELDMIVVAGGGQLDDFWGGALGHPYVLWRWSRYAKAKHARYVVLSVGTGSLRTKLARRFVTSALATADYRSFRDAGSRSLVGNPRFESDPVVPDLAFGLAENFGPRILGRPRLRVALSPIAYADPRSWPAPDARRYRSYFERTLSTGRALLEMGHDLVLYGTDNPDLVCATDLKTALVGTGPTGAAERVTVSHVATLERLFDELRNVDLVIAARLHGLILPLLLKLPVIAISYERKVATLMRQLGLESECLFQIDDFSSAELIARVRDVLARSDALERHIETKVTDFRAQVSAQYDRVFGGPELAV